LSRAHYDVIIVGSGVVGSVAALALAKNTSLKIALLESQSISLSWQPTQYDHRVSAISLASKRLFQQMGVWADMETKRIAPYTHMHVWDASGAGKIDFDCHEVHEEALGYIIEDSVMRVSLLEQIFQTSSIDFISPVKLISLHKKSEKIELETQDGKIFSTTLLIGADGANSWVREQSHISFKNSDYHQAAIVATVQTTLSHQHTAWQRFLATGPLAFLPLSDEKTCSIVWSTSHDEAAALLKLNDKDFCEQLTTAFDKKLGEVIQVSQRYHFPLRMRHAKNYVQERIALIGDAAHTIHPLAGQGVNLGLLDAASLVDVMMTALHKRRDFSSLATLRQYERSRKSDNVMMLASVDLLKQLFAQQNALVKNARTAGLSLIDRCSFVKNRLTQYALGNR